MARFLYELVTILYVIDGSPVGREPVHMEIMLFYIEKWLGKSPCTVFPRVDSYGIWKDWKSIWPNGSPPGLSRLSIWKSGPGI
jgi:hypothetical protein